MQTNFITKADFTVDEAGLISGMAWPFGAPDRTGDTIEPGAFKGAKAPLPVLFGHDAHEPLGTWENVIETGRGLEVKGRLLIDDVARAREVRALIQAKAVTGLSIGFMTKSAKQSKNGGRIITALELWEISIVTFPAHPGARISSAKSAIFSLSAAEQINRAALALRRK